MTGGSYITVPTSGNRDSWNTNIYNLYWDSVITDSLMDRHPLFQSLVRLGKTASTPTMQFNWINFKDRLRSITVASNTAPGTGLAGTIVMASGDQGKVTKGNIITDTTTGSSYYVTAVSTTSLTAFKISETTSGTWGTMVLNEAAGHTLFVDSMNISDGWGDIANIGNYVSTKQNENLSNYCADYTKYTNLNEIAANEGRHIDKSKRDEEFARNIVRMMDEMEISLFRSNGGVYQAPGWLGNEGEDRVYFSKGIDSFDIQSATGAITTYTWKDFRNFIHEDVRNWNMRPELNAYVNLAMLNKIDEWVEDTNPFHYADGSGNAKLGWKVKQLETSLATINLFPSLALTDGYPRDEALMYILNLDHLKLRYFSGDEDDFHMKVVKDPDRQYKNHRRNIVDEINSKCGIQVGAEQEQAKLHLS